MNPATGADDWVVVWERSGRSADVQADLTVALLEGSGLPVVRIPPCTAPIVFDGFGGPMLPVILLVPPDRADEAKELLEGSEDEGAGVEPE
jgi:hypothetical protein